MTSKITLFVFALLLTGFCFAQTPGPPSVSEEFIFNPDKKPCLIPEQRSYILQNLQNSIEELRLQNRLLFSEQRRGGHPLFIWPVQKASNVTFNDVWAISGYVDHNASFPNQLLDYNGGTKTYDTASGYNHQGVDIYTWPYTWKLLDDDSVEIIAAADGQIIDKNDGEFDRSCDFNSNVWNAIYVQHGDGSVAWYGHMKNGSLSSKNIGDTVTQGEYLGVVGSSGNSTGPHLHFEVYTDASYSQLVDPFYGSHNSMNSDSWWANQKPYVNPKINALLTHTQAPDIFPPCPTTETTYTSNEFDISDPIAFAVYLRDQTVDDNVFLEIIRPDNSTLFADWNFDATFSTSSVYYVWFLWTGYFDMVGEWKWRVTFGGETVTHTFNVSNPLSIEENDFSKTSIYPNPFNAIVNINSTAKIKKASIVDMLGKTVLVVNQKSEEGINELNLAQLSNGMYFVTLEGEQNQRKTIKLIKK